MKMEREEKSKKEKKKKKPLLRTRPDQKKETETEEKKKSNTNKEVILITYVFAGLFLLIIGFYVHFMLKDSEEVINNPYNKRQDLLAKQIIRGDIISADGKVLAHTLTDSEGNETRDYPYDNMYAHVVGRFQRVRQGWNPRRIFTF